jgi:hypothetical protein
MAAHVTLRARSSVRQSSSFKKSGVMRDLKKGWSQ